MTDGPDFLRAGEIAHLAGVSVRSVRRWIAEGTLPSVKLRGVRLVPRKHLERMLAPAPAPASNLTRKCRRNSQLVSDRESISQTQDVPNRSPSAAVDR